MQPFEIMSRPHPTDHNHFIQRAPNRLNRFIQRQTSQLLYSSLNHSGTIASISSKQESFLYNGNGHSWLWSFRKNETITLYCHIPSILESLQNQLRGDQLHVTTHFMNASLMSHKEACLAVYIYMHVHTREHILTILLMQTRGPLPSKQPVWSWYFVEPQWTDFPLIAWLQIADPQWICWTVHSPYFHHCWINRRQNSTFSKLHYSQVILLANTH